MPFSVEGGQRPDDLFIFSGTSNEPLAGAFVSISAFLCAQPASAASVMARCAFSLAACAFRDVYGIQSLTRPVHRHLMQMLMMIDIARHGDARRVTAVITIMRMAGRTEDAPHISIAAKLVAQIIRQRVPTASSP